MRDQLLDVLKASSPPAAFDWLRERIAEQEAHFQRNAFYFAFSGVSRHFPKHDRIPDDLAEKVDASGKVPGFSIRGWDLFRLARVILLLTLAEQDQETCLTTLFAVLDTADVRERVAIYSASPLLPWPDHLRDTIIEGLRSNIVDVFDSIALNNPFPAAHFSEASWNQMVLKALFLSRPIYHIYNLEQRRNPALALAISELAHERWAAGRKLSSEAWRNCIGFIDDGIAKDLRHLLNTGESHDRQAAALVLAEDSNSLIPEDLRETLKEEIAAVADEKLSWQTLGEAITPLVVLNGSPTPSQSVKRS